MTSARQFEQLKSHRDRSAQVRESLTRQIRSVRRKKCGKKSQRVRQGTTKHQACDSELGVYSVDVHDDL